MSENKEPAPKKTNPIKHFLSGGFGGICTVVSGHPFDTIKVRLQTQQTYGNKPQYTGMMDCVKQTFFAEGFRGFYKGMSAPLTAIVPIFAINFFTYGIGKNIQQHDPSIPLTKKQIFLAGAFSGVWTSFVMAPGERVKCLLQIQKTGTKLYDGSRDCIQKLYKTGGIPSVYKGFCATLLRDVPGSGMYFLTYEVLQRLLTPKGKDAGNIGIWRTILAGGSTGIAYWAVAMPADVLKSRFQTAPEGTYPNGVRDVYKKLIKEEGVAALYTGVAPIMLRAFPANAACFLGFEIAMHLLNLIFP